MGESEFEVYELKEGEKGLFGVNARESLRKSKEVVMQIKTSEKAPDRDAAMLKDDIEKIEEKREKHLSNKDPIEVFDSWSDLRSWLKGKSSDEVFWVERGDLEPKVVCEDCNVFVETNSTDRLERLKSAHTC